MLCEFFNVDIILNVTSSYVFLFIYVLPTMTRGSTETRKYVIYRTTLNNKLRTIDYLREYLTDKYIIQLNKQITL